MARQKKKNGKVTIHTPGRARGTADLWFVFPDTHFPDQDPEALELVLEVHRILHPEYSLFLGDILDCGLFSSHAKRTIAEDTAYDYKKLEIDPCNAMIDTVQENTKFWTYYLEGNHEARIERWAVNNGRAGESIYNLISPKATLATGRDNYTQIPYEEPTGNRMGYVEIVSPLKKMRTGGLVAVHGWSHAKAAARRHLELSRSRSIIYGHTHRAQTEVSRDPWSGNIIKSWSPGCLSKLQPFYAHGGAPSEWTHGFSLIYVGQTSWTEYNISIVKGSCVLPSGEEIKL